MTYQWPARMASMIAKWVTGSTPRRGSFWPNVGSQYRSAIFYYTPAQQAAAVGVLDDRAAEQAEQESGRDHDESELQVVDDDLAVGEAEGLEDGDLLALHRDLAAHHRADHERGDAEEHQREADRKHGERADFVGQAGV